MTQTQMIIKTFFSIMIYFAVGLLTYLICYAPEGSTWAAMVQDPWTVTVVIIWPLIWLYYFTIFVIVAAAAGCIIAIAIGFGTRWYEQRKVRQEMATVQDAINSQTKR